MLKALIRLRALIVKELLTTLRDPRSRIILVVPPLVQLVVFGRRQRRRLRRL